MISRFLARATFSPVTSFAAVLLFSVAPSPDLRAQDAPLKIGVIDMQECLTKYYRTDQETSKLNEIAKEKRKELDERNADFMSLNKLLADQDKIYQATELPAEKRNAAAARMQELLQERAAKQNEIQEFQRRIQSDMMNLRTEMESTLVDEAKKSVTEIAEAEGLDIVHDRSFLPRANKAIVFISPKVKDITEAVIGKLNVDAPPASETAPPAEGESGATTPGATTGGN